MKTEIYSRITMNNPRDIVAASNYVYYYYAYARPAGCAEISDL